MKFNILYVDPPWAYNDIVREKIVELAGDLPRAELFARNEYPGWVCVGNEIDGMDIRDSLRMLKER